VTLKLKLKEPSNKQDQDGLLPWGLNAGPLVDRGSLYAEVGNLALASSETKTRGWGWLWLWLAFAFARVRCQVHVAYSCP